MKNELRVLEKRIVFFDVTNVADFDLQIWIIFVLVEILQPPAGKIVNDTDSMAFAQQQVNHVTADKTRSARDD